MPYAALRTAIALLLLLSAAVPDRAPAQEQPATVPTNLVLALFGDPWPTGGALPARVFVGRAPADFLREALPPAPATVVGGIARGGQGTVVLAYPTPSADALASYLAFLARAGWTRSQDGERRGGFVEAVPMQYAALCRDTSRMFVRPAPGAATGSYVSVTVHHDSRMAGCAERPEFRPFTELPFPELRAPAGVPSRGGGGGSGGDNSTFASTRLLTAMRAPDLVAHYGAQLEAAGWTVGVPLAAGALAARAVEARDSRGRVWRGALSVVELTDSRDVVLRMTRAAAPQ